MNLLEHRPSRAAISGIVVALIFLLLAIFAIEVLLIVFAAVLLATLLHAGARFIARWTGMGEGYALACFVVAILALLAVLVLVAAPAVLLALAESPALGVYVVILYVAVQVIEDSVMTPLIQQWSIALPPALILAAQLLMAGMAGLLGLALATPLVAVAITLTQLLYVQGYLERAKDGTPPGAGCVEAETPKR